MKVESLVIAHQHGAVNTFRALYTPPVTPPELGVPEVARLTFLEAGAEGMLGKGGESRNKVAVPEGAAGSPPFSVKGISLKDCTS